MRVSSLNVNHGNDVMMAQFSFLSSSHKRDFPRTFTGNGLQKLSMFLVFKKKSAEIFHRLNTLINHRNDFKKVLNSSETTRLLLLVPRETFSRHFDGP